MEFDTATTLRAIQNFQFNPDRLPHATLKAFNEFIEQYKFRYEAQYLDFRNTQLKLVLQNELQQQRKNLCIQILNL